jgi:hypothetical protein
LCLPGNLVIDGSLVVVARRFRLWGKKRGERRTGSKLLGSVGEALFFAALFFLGCLSLAAVVTTQLVHAVEGSSRFSVWGLSLVLLVTASFILIGGGGVILTVLHVGASAERRSAMARRAANIELLSNTLPSTKEYPNVPRDANLTNSPGVTLTYRLPIVQSPIWKLAAATAFCLVWNSIASVLLVLAIDSHVSGKPEWFLTLFVVPFVAIGVWAVYYFARQFLIHTGIGPTSVEISDHPLQPGKRYSVYVSQAGRLSVQSLELLLACEEEATYHQGTDVRTDVQRVYEQRVFCREDFEIMPGIPFEHECELRIPHRVMHSFKSNYNAIQWKLVVKGNARGWPIYERSFPVVVYPHVCRGGGP